MGNTPRNNGFYRLDLFDENLSNTLPIFCMDRALEPHQMNLENLNPQEINEDGIREFQDQLDNCNKFYEKVAGDINEFLIYKKEFENIIDRLKIYIEIPDQSVVDIFEEQYLLMIFDLVQWNMNCGRNPGGNEEGDLIFSNYSPGILINNEAQLPEILKEKYKIFKDLFSKLPEYIKNLLTLGKKMIEIVIDSRDTYRQKLFNIAEKHSEISVKAFGYIEIRLIKNFKKIRRFAFEIEELFKNCKECLQKANKIIKICSEQVEDLKMRASKLNFIDFDDSDGSDDKMRKIVRKFIKDKIRNE